ncbi:MAG: hypothetical protein AAFR38_11040 [Planctomycetota bacterium]
MTRRSARTILAAVALTTVLVGCSSKNSISSLRSNPSPELRGLARTHDEAKNQDALTITDNWRMVSDDASRFFLLDRPSRLHPLVAPK